MANRKPRSRSPRGQAWEKVGVFMLDKGSKRLLRVLDEMEDEAYVETYLKLLRYFQPVLTSSTVKQEGDINISLVSDDSDLINKI